MDKKKFIKFIIFIIVEFIVLFSICMYLISPSNAIESKDVILNKHSTTIRYIKAFITVVSGDNAISFSYGDKVNVVLPLPKENETHAQILVNNNIYMVSRDLLTNNKPMMKYVGTFNLTAYAWSGYRCAIGKYPRRDHTVAAHSSDFPLGTKLYIEGYGIFTVEDRGAFPKKTIDIYIGDKDKCIAFGRRKAKVYILSRGNNKRYTPEKYNPSFKYR